MLKDEDNKYCVDCDAKGRRDRGATEGEMEINGFFTSAFLYFYLSICLPF